MGDYNGVFVHCHTAYYLPGPLIRVFQHLGAMTNRKEGGRSYTRKRAPLLGMFGVLHTQTRAQYVSHLETSYSH